MSKEIKLCGTRSMMDLSIAVAAGADAVGIIGSRERLTRNTVDYHRAGWFVRNTPDHVTSVLVPRSTDPDDLVYLANTIKPDRIQLGETEDPALARALCQLDDRPDIAQVVHVDNSTRPDAIDPFLDFVDYIHLDTKSPERPGGTGLTHDWGVSRRLADAAHEAGKLVILSGGLTPPNVARAIDIVGPDGVDVETGIKDLYGAHDQMLAEQFVKAAQTAFGAREMVG